MVRSGKNAISSFLILVCAAGFLALSGAVDAARADYSVTLAWTAPGDDSTVGKAVRYDMRYSVVPITEASFSSAWVVPGVPAPAVAGTRQSVTIGSLLNATYYFAIKTVDAKGNWSGISNIVVYTPNATPGGSKGATGALAFSAPQPNPARDLTRFVFDLPRPANIMVEVLDVLGRRVRLLADEFRPSGPNPIEWHLDDASARPLPAGVYLVRARALGEVFLRRLAVIR